MNDNPVDLDKHRGMTAQKATDMRRLLAEVEGNAKIQRDQQAAVEKQLLLFQQPPGLTRLQRRVMC